MQDQPSTAPQSAATTRVDRPRKQQEEGVKVILEQVLVAFILAFIFRAFVLEAFVIPTGSMATTLLGAHMRFTCPDCAWPFTVNYHADTATGQVPPYARIAIPTARGMEIHDRVYAIRCPNCDYRLPRNDPADPDNDATAPPVSFGDRILVLKHLYLIQDPQRWDVVVFKNPSRSTPQHVAAPYWSTEPYQQNYIKRLVGLPGDTLMILDGDIYVTTAQKTLAELGPEDFTIARKHDVAQSGLWRVVYDDNHRPQGRQRTYQTGVGLPLQDPPFQMPWRTGEGWEQVPTSEGGGFRFAGEAEGTLSFDPDANRNTFAFRDFLTYNIAGTLYDQRYPNEGPVANTFDRDFSEEYVARWGLQINTVSDLRLSLFYERHAGEGPLTLRMTKWHDAFEAELTDGSVRVRRIGPQGQVIFEREEPVSGAFTRPRQIDFVNADYQITVRVDGRTVFQSTDTEYAPDVAWLLEAELDNEIEQRPEVAITAFAQEASLRHVSLWRDVYYTARDDMGRLAGRNIHASPFNFPNNVMRLGEDEYFVLGDNPFLSGDARSWRDRLVLEHEDLDVEDGRVPGRFMLGRAFFVYWPASYRPAPGMPSIVPNFGDMRFIR